jgi:hypothetical protein
VISRHPEVLHHYLGQKMTAETPADPVGQQALPKEVRS